MGARTQEEARSFIVSSLRRRLWASSSAASLHATASAGCRTSACRGPSSSGACSAASQLIGGPQARVPLYVPYADFFQYQAGAGRLQAGRA